MTDLLLDAQRTLEARVARIEQVLTMEGAFVKLDESLAAQQAEHDKNLAELNDKLAKQAAEDAADPTAPVAQPQPEPVA